MPRYRPMPITLRTAQAFIDKHHRHHKGPRGSKFTVGASDESGALIGVVVVGRPNARLLDDGRTSEVTRTCVTGEKNANSFLYGIAHQIAKAMGYRKQITYTEEGESGISLRAAGFTMTATLPPRGNWAQCSRKLRGIRNESIRAEVTRYRWEKSL